jgi:hypothetical protein
MTLEVSTEATSPLPKVSKKDRKDRKSKKSASALLDEVEKTVFEPEAATPALNAVPKSGEFYLEKPKKIKKTKGLALGQLDGSVDNAPSSSDPSTLPSEIVSLEEPSQPKKSKKRKHKEALSDATEALIAALESIPESDEEKQQQPTLTVTKAPSEVDETPTKKKKKFKRTSKDAVAEVPEEGGEPKKRQKSSKYPNPAEDSELSDQAQKGGTRTTPEYMILPLTLHTALGYANSFVNDKATWKFNKAMQNWLVRNFWSETLVNHYCQSKALVSRNADQSYGISGARTIHSNSHQVSVHYTRRSPRGNEQPVAYLASFDKPSFVEHHR